MADNYLERRYEEVFGRGAKAEVRTPRKPSLDTLLFRNRSFRGYDKSYTVHRLQLEAIISVNAKVASSGNTQMLRFRPVTKGPEAELVLKHVKMGKMLSELNLPFPGTEPEAFIIVCSKVAENANVCIDLGISLQSMLLKAVEIGLGGLIIRSFDREEISTGLNLPLEPLAIVAIGKPAERIELVPVREGDGLRYFRTAEGIHKVPKIVPEDLILQNDCSDQSQR